MPTDASWPDQGAALFGQARRDFHASLLTLGILTFDKNGVASNADKDSETSKAYAGHVATLLRAETGVKLAGQTAGGKFELAVADYLTATFLRLSHLRPGQWEIAKVGSRRGVKGISKFEQYAHLKELDTAVSSDSSLLAILGNAYAIAPDVVIGRLPESDEAINAREHLVDDIIATRAALRREVQSRPILHANISCKWTLRSDRAQNARSEAINLIRNRKGRVPHAVVVTAEPMPTRISSLALGTGDIDCVYHFALPELVAALASAGKDDVRELLDVMISGNRLKDIADLPLDLAV